MPSKRESIFVKYNYPVGIAAIGFGGVLLNNYRHRKPYFSGIQWHIFAVAAGGLIGHGINKALDYAYAERDAQIRHYIETHPEDFIETRRKYKEIFDEWIPVR